MAPAPLLSVPSSYIPDNKLHNAGPSTPKAKTYKAHTDPESTRFLQAEDQMFMVYAPPLSEGSTFFREAFRVSTQGLGEADPLFVHGCSPKQLRIFLWAVYTNTLPPPSDVSLPCLFPILEMTYKVNYAPLKQWCIEALQTMVTSRAASLRSGTSLTFMRLLRLSIWYKQDHLADSIKSRWLSRVYWRELSPIPVMQIAYMNGYRHLFSHAAYVYMVDNWSIITSSGGAVGLGCSLSPKINTHVLCGFHSLSAYWEGLSKTPLYFPSHCDQPSSCTAAWTKMWSVMVDGPCHLPTCDVLHRLSWLEQNFEADPYLNLYMCPQCRSAALQAVAKKRAEVSNNLHHHFDL